MKEFKIYSVSDRYISFLQERFPNVYSNKEQHRTHTRKYIGIVIEINGFAYYIPLSSPNDTDYQTAGDGKIIKRSIIPIYRIVVKNSKGEKELKGTLRISHMIPVPENELELYDLEHEQDKAYRDLVQDEIIFIRKHADKIRSNANVMYHQKINNDQTAKYVRAALDFKAIEEACQQFMNNIQTKTSGRKYRVNKFCPHCGEEHCCWTIVLTEEEQRVLDAYYESKKDMRESQSNLANLLDDIGSKPLVVKRSLRCGVCNKDFDANITVFKENEIGYHNPDSVPVGSEPVW